LRVIKPTVVSVHFSMSSLRFFITVRLDRVRTSSSITFPLSCYRKLTPGLREKLAHINAIEMSLPVFPSHPPVTIILKGVVKTFAYHLVFIPGFIFILEFSFPFTMSPGVSYTKKLKRPWLNVFEIFNSL
jgi:hypothetical protein